MKLYTEEQLHKAYDAGMQFIGEDKGSPIEFFSSLTPIELPSDEEISEESPYVPSDASLDFWAHKEGFIDGAKWMRDKIQGGNNG